MADLTFTDSHNMVAYLEISEDNVDFAEIVDFLNVSPIRYALTVSPTIYVSYIEKFWSTTKTKTVTNETQIRAKVSSKSIVITESSMRRYLHFNDEDDKAVHEEREGSVERAATTATSLDAEQGSGNINRTQSMAIPNAPFPQGIGSGVGRINVETTEIDGPLYKKLSERVLDIGESELDEARLEREREEEASKAANIAKWDDVQAMMDADYELATKLQAEEQGEISIEERSKLFVELMNERKKHFARLRAEEQRRKPLTKAQKRNQMSNYLKNMAGYTLQQLRGYSFDEIKTLFETTMRKVNTFVPIESEVDRAVPELAARSSKRAAEEELDQESSKRQKTGESSELAKEPRDKEADELSQEELQQMMIIVPEQGMNVEALQTKYPIIDWEIYTEGTRKYWKIIRVGNHTESLVKEKFNSTEPTDDKEREIWVELKRLFKPDIDDELWKLQKHIHDLTWKLYDSCGVHHVSTEKGIDIYMLVEKEYPLSRGTLTLMLVAKLLVDQDNEMSRELLRKIFMQIQKVNIKFRGGLLGLKGFLVLLKLMLLVMIITAAGYVSTTAGENC
ncbi:hypothetical protein Tco_1053358 [Tanacetum coccineum]